MLIIFIIVIVTLTGLSEGEGILPDGPLNGSVGGKVIFTTTLAPKDPPYSVINWKFGTVFNIISCEPAGNTTPPEYEGRITLFTSTGSLELRNLKLGDTGQYNVIIFPDHLGSTTLNVYEPVSRVTVTPNNTELVEFKDSVSLSCSSFGSPPFSFLWMNGSSEVTASDRVQITDGGSTLVIVDVTQHDQGPYSCHVSNPVSDAVSDPVHLTFSYGPENIKLTLSPSQGPYEEGSNINLICSAESRPPAQFTWFLNGTQLSDTGPELTLEKIQMDQTGNYSCQAFNNKTLRYQTSEPASVSVLERVSSVVVTPNNTDLVEFKDSVSLSCSSSGSSLSFLWMNDSSEITASDRVQITDGNSTLVIVDVTRYDQGPYSCHVSNSFSSGISNSVKVSISYGPENIELKISPSQDGFEEGSDISLFCSVLSRPDAVIQWFLNADQLSDTGPDLKLINVEIDQSGNYSCKAFNSKTLRYQTSPPAVISVYENRNGGLPGWAIALIVIACIVIVAGVGATVYYFIKRKPKKTSSMRNISTAAGGGQQGNAVYGSEELNYADVRFSRNKNVATVNVGSENVSSTYAHIKVNNTKPAGSSPPTYDVHMQQANRRVPQADGNGAQTYAQVHRK